MTMLFTVYDAKGEPFEVLPALAKHLVIAEGWSMEPPAAPVAEVASVMTIVKQSDDHTPTAG